jgi:hypothetical protein
MAQQTLISPIVAMYVGNKRIINDMGLKDIAIIQMA